MSDNWNLLAKLLGTPGPPAPPKTETKKKAESIADEDDHAAASDPSGFSDRDSNEPAARDMPPVAEAVADASDESGLEDEIPSAEDVLEALTTESASAQLPGFGVRARDPRIEELAAGGPPASEEPVVEELLHVETSVSESDKLFDDRSSPESPEAAGGDADEATEPESAAWSELAGELGIQATDEPPPHRAPMQIKPTRKESAPPKSRRAPKSFGDGLGIDLGPEPVVDQNDAADEPDALPAVQRTRTEAPERSQRDEPKFNTPRSIDPPDPLSFRSFSDLDDESGDEGDDQDPVQATTQPKNESPKQDRTPARDERARRRRSFDEPDEAEAAERSSPAAEQRGRPERGESERSGSSDSPSRDRDEDGESPRRRSGRRGRRGQRQRMSEESLESESRTVDDAINRDEEDFVGNLDDSHSGTSKRRSRGSEPGRRMISRDEFDPIGDDDFELVDDEFELGVDADADDSEDEAEDSGARRRRRGRRGRGGRRPRGGSDADSDDVRPQSRGRDDADLDDDLDEEPIPESAFDDDHEDDEEVDVIRRGRRRRGRRGGRGRSTRESEPADQEVRDSAPRGLDDEDARPRRGARNRQDEPDSESRDESGTRRKIVPTWQEVVNLLVDNNLENHKKTPSSKGRGRGRRR